MDNLPKNPLRVLVCGGREYKDKERVYLELDTLDSHFGPLLIISGVARGADSFGIDWGEERGYEVLKFPADWHTYGRAAGHIRNQQMLQTALPDLVLAFPGGTGTADMVRRALKAGVEVKKIG